MATALRVDATTTTTTTVLGWRGTGGDTNVTHSSSRPVLQCTSDLNCSLNGVCGADGVCACDRPWTGPRCGVLAFAAQSPATGRSLYPANDTFHNTWNGPIMYDESEKTYHMYAPLYPAGLLYHPVALMHGVSLAREGPWTWSNTTGLPVSINPGALVYTTTTPLGGAAQGSAVTRYTLWFSRPDGATVGSVYASGSAAGPFTYVPGSNATGCYINPSPLYVNGSLYCTGQKGTTLMRAETGNIGGPWQPYATISHRGEDPFLWVDSRGNWHAVFHTAGNPGPVGTHCGNSTVSSHAFSDDAGRTWHELSNPAVEPYKPTVSWEGATEAQTYATMERPHLYFGPGDETTGRATHLGVASTLNIGDEGCPHAYPSPGCRHKGQTCSCSACKYVSHAGTLLISLA
eukprot:UC1_evm1s1666